MARKKIWNFRREQPGSTWFNCIPKKHLQIKKQERIIKDLLRNPGFERAILDLRKEFKIKAGELTAIINEGTEARLRNSQGIKLFNKKLTQYGKRIKDQKIIKLLKRFELSPLWYGPIYRYLTQNEMSPIEIKCDIIAAEDKYGRDRLFIEVFTDTTLEDIKEAWNSVIEYQKKLPFYYRKTIRNPRNREIHTDILRWLGSGKSTSEVYNRLLPKRYPDYCVNPETIRKIKERGKRAIKKLS